MQRDTYKASRHLQRAQELLNHAPYEFGGGSGDIVDKGYEYRLWSIGGTHMQDSSVIRFLEFINSMENVPNSGLGLGKCRDIAGVIANSLKQTFTTWESGNMWFQCFNSSVEILNESEKMRNAEMIVHRADPQTVAFTYDPIGQIMYILDFADGYRFDIVIGKCSNDEFFTGPSWWHDGTFISLYGGPHDDPNSRDANLSRDSNGRNVWNLDYESCTRSNPVSNFLWKNPTHFKEVYFKTHDPNIAYLDQQPDCGKHSIVDTFLRCLQFLRKSESMDQHS